MKAKLVSAFLINFIVIVNLNSQNKLLSEQINILKKYDADHLFRIAMPIGGIGTGTFSLGGRGQLQDWEIMNVPAKGYSTTLDGNDAPHFVIFTKNKNGKATTKALIGPFHPSEYQGQEGSKVNHHGLPRFRNANFEASYPFGIVNLWDENMPVKVKLIGYNPFIPGDADASGIPMGILKYEVTNTTKEEIEVSICGNMRNFIGRDGRDLQIDWKGNYIPKGAKDNYNIYQETENIAGIFMQSKGVDAAHRAWGTIALTTPKNNGEITYRTSSVKNEWNRSMLDFWDDFSADGKLSEKLEKEDDDPMASLAVKRKLKAGETSTFTFYISWHFPNRMSWGSWSHVKEQYIGNYYTSQYKNAWEVLQKEVPRINALTDKTIFFVNSFNESSYSDVIKEAALFNLSTLRSQTIFRAKSGHLFGWEGVFDNYGSCFGSCTHVWNYEVATPYLFGELAQTMREVEFKYSTKENGHMSFRANLPLELGTKFGRAAADGQMGTIVKIYREWQLSGDSEFLKSLWPKVKAAMEFSWIPGGWDANLDGVMEGVQHNTMDVEYFGPNPQIQFWYLAALRATSSMAAIMKDKPLAKKCSQLFKQGSQWTDENLFNGEYYFHIFQKPESLESVAEGTIGREGKKYFKDPLYQLKNGCLIDQLVGQYMAHNVGFGHLAKKENIRKAISSVYKYNKKESMYDHFNNMRSYAIGDEKALLMVSYPNGGRPKIPFPYWAEVMTGFEYTAAIGMLYEGMNEQALEIIQNIRNRYDGAKRNPFDEAECGHHYARAMASWAGILAESRFNYSGVEKTMNFTDKTGKYFWSNGHAWGSIKIENNNNKPIVVFEVLHGEIELSKLIIGTKEFKNSNVKLKEGDKLEF